MEKKNTLWFEECMESLFCGGTNNWVYHKIWELIKKSNKTGRQEEVIQETKLRFQALLSNTLDVFTGDRMGLKSYQIPFNLFQVVKSILKEPIAAIATEALMSVANWDYRVHSNLLKMILLDDNPEMNFIEKMTVFFMALENCKQLEDMYMDDCRRMSLAQFYPNLLLEVSSIDYDNTRKLLERIRKSSKHYFLLYDSILWKINEREIPQNRQGLYQECVESKTKFLKDGFEEELEYFIEKDMVDYISKGNEASYNPFWIFGSRKYKENLDFILNRKELIEFESVWIQYLELKANDEGKQLSYISSFKSYKLIDLFQ